jgi:peptidoglycan/LPS O-acetylase OafA/YrhL
VGITSYVLFFLAGIAFGYAAPTRWKWLPILFPIALALLAVFIHGFDGAIVIRLIIAIIVTALGVFVGMMIDARAESRADHPRYA